jgi:hypothetical protein
VAVILTPSRPLWPAKSFFDWTAHSFPENVLLARARMVYNVYQSRNDLFASLRRNIPESVQVIGLIAGSDDAESSLWRPFGARRVVRVLEGDRRQESNLHWLVVKDGSIGLGNTEDFDRWMQRDGGTLVTRQSMTEKVGRGPESWSIVHFPGGSD